MPGIAKYGISLANQTSLFSPARVGDSVQGLAWDGTFYYVAYSAGSNRISKYDSAFTEVLTNANAATLLNSVAIASLGDICVYNGFLWVASGNEGTNTLIFKIDPATLTYVAHFDITAGFGTDSANGIARYGSNWYIASAYLNARTFHVDIYDDTFTTRIGSAYVSPGVHENGCQSLAVWGRYMFGGMHRGTMRVWYIKDDGTLEVVQEFAGFTYTYSGTANTQGLDVLGNQLWVLDRVGTGTNSGQVYRADLSELTSGVLLPTRYDPAIWLDAADSAALVLSGSNVTTWRDKAWSTTSLAQGTAGNQPLRISAAQNGKDIVRFDNTDDFMSLAGNVHGRRLSGFSVLAAAAFTAAAPASNRALFFLTQGTGSARVSLYIEATTKNLGFGGRKADIDGFDGAVTSSAVDSAFRLYGGVASFGGTATIYQDGTQIAQDAAFSTSGISDNTGGDVAVTQGAGFPLGCDVGEILYFAHALSTTDRQIFEGYLAWKWGLQANLPGGHPYKNAAPALDPSGLPRRGLQLRLNMTV
jgi:hypothetical protein